MAAHVQDAIGDLPAQHLIDTSDDIVMGEHRLALRPAGDALPQRAALVPPRLTGSQAGVHMHVWLDVRRAEHGPAHVDFLSHAFDADSGALHRSKAALVDEHVDEALRRSTRRSQSAIADHKLHHTPTSFTAGL